jgi:hypothetical protein
MSETSKNPAVTEEFRKSISDFVEDIIHTFPEHKENLEKWIDSNTEMCEFQELFEHCLHVYPERFFDILNQNVDIFAKESEINVEFFPGLDFKQLIHCEGVSEKTKESIWKYLQIILLIVVKSMQDKVDFGDAMNIFNELNVDDLQKQLEKSLKDITSFFEDNMKEFENMAKEEGEQDQKTSEPRMPNLPRMGELHEHLQTLFDGKIGKLAKELAEDLGNDLAESLGADIQGANSTQEVLSKLMQNPEKMGNVVKSVKDKLADKMQSGEISREDLVNEASEMMDKMKGLGGAFGNMNSEDGMGGLGGLGNMGDLFKTMAQNMGVKVPKGAKLDNNKITQMEKRSNAREKLKARAIQKKQEEVIKKLEEEASRLRRQQEYDQFMRENPDFLENATFSLEDKQEKSAVRDPNKLTANQKKRAKKKAKKQKEKEKSNNSTA